MAIFLNIYNIGMVTVSICLRELKIAFAPKFFLPGIGMFAMYFPGTRISSTGPT